MLVTQPTGGRQQAPVVTTVLNPRSADYCNKHQIPSSSNHQRSHSWISAHAPGNGAATPSVHSGVRKGGLRHRCLGGRPRTRLERALTVLLVCSLVLLLLLCFRDSISSSSWWPFSSSSSRGGPQRPPFTDSYIQTISEWALSRDL